jgi:hypothetical protein
MRGADRATLFSESLCNRFARFVLDLLLRKRVGGVVTSFFHNSLHARPTSQDMLLAHTAAAKWGCASATRNENGDGAKGHISRAFPHTTNRLMIDLSDFLVRVRLPRSESRNARKIWCCADCSNARCSENAGFFIAL